MKRFSKLSIVIPVYNEKYTAEQLVESVWAAPLPAGLEREIVLVNDASTDGSDVVLARLAEKHPSIRLVTHPVNRGKGAAIRTAIEHATGDLLVVQDADLEYDPNEYGRLLEPILRGDADVVYGSRFMGSECRRVLMFWHSLGNKLLTTLSNIFTNLNLTDMETCYKLAKASLWKSIPIRCNRFGVEPEITAKFAKRGCRIYEVPISYRGRSYGEGKKITWRDGLKALGLIVYFALVDDVYIEKYGHSILYSLSKTRRFNRWMADVIRPWIGDEVLEIGAGMGNITEQILPRKYYMITDIDPLYLEYLEGRFGISQRVGVAHVDVGKSADFESLRGRFDTVICLNVVEHVEEDRVALRNLYEALRPGGRACVLVPRGPGLFGTLDQQLEHHRRYTRREFSDKLREAGFTLEKMFDFNRISVPAWFLNGKILRRKTFDKVQLKLFDATLWFWRRADRLLPWRGLSLVAIARKP